MGNPAARKEVKKLLDGADDHFEAAIRVAKDAGDTSGAVRIKKVREETEKIRKDFESPQ